MSASQLKRAFLQNVQIVYMKQSLGAVAMSSLNGPLRKLTSVISPVSRRSLQTSSCQLCDDKGKGSSRPHGVDSAAFVGLLSTGIYGKFQRVAPQKVSRRLEVPGNIPLPDYWFRYNGEPPKPVPRHPTIKTADEVKVMKETCQLTKYVLEETLKQAKPGVSTDDLDKFAHNLIIKNKGFPSALTYRQFPKSICTSVNNVACHGIPDERKLEDGDVVTVDVMVYKNGFHGDCAGTTLVGGVDEPGKGLVKVAQECLDVGIQQCGPGVPLENIGKAIDAHAEERNMSVIHVFTGHGIGRNIHELPDVYHFDRPSKQKELMTPGMTFTIEPVITQGMDLIMVLDDGWTAVTMDGARAAQFEHTILITDTGYEILTTV